MDRPLYRYAFAPDVPIAEVEGTLALSLIAVEGLHGEAAATLDAGHAFDAGRRTCVLDAVTPVGADFNRLFAQFLGREFGPGAFTVQRLVTTSDAAVPPTAAPKRD